MANKVNVVTKDNLARFKENSDKIYVSEAPKDGNMYVRVNGTWVPLSVDSGRDILADYVLIQNQGWSSSVNTDYNYFDTITIGGKEYKINARRPSSLLIPKNGNSTLTIKFQSATNINSWSYTVDGCSQTSNNTEGTRTFELEKDKFSIITYRKG